MGSTIAPMKTSPIAAIAVASRAILVGRVIFLAGRMALASRKTLTPP
jgi:hypothetical protein